MSKAVSAVIDIGATHGGHGISFYHEYKEKPLSISHKRSVPLLLWDSSPCLLFTKDKVLDSLYYEAEDKYIHLGEKNDWYFFTSFLRSISNSEEPPTKSTKLKAIDGKEMLALDVYSAVIKYVKDLSLRDLDVSSGLSLTDIRWVLIVPANWDTSARRFMKKAAESAGLNSDQVLIVNEEESAVAYCKHFIKERLQSKCDFDAFPACSTDSKYLVLYCGEDESRAVTVIDVENHFSLKELYKPIGGIGGANMVVEAYRELLNEIVGASLMEYCFLNYKKEYIDMFRSFKEKMRRANAEQELIRISFAPVLIRKLREGVNKNTIEIISKSKFGGEIQLSHSKIQMTSVVFLSLFEVVGGRIIDHICNILQNPELINVKSIVMVGIFAECHILQHMLKQAFPYINFVIPTDNRIATLIGSVICGHEYERESEVASSRVKKFVKCFKSE